MWGGPFHIHSWISSLWLLSSSMFTWGMFQTGTCFQNQVWLNSGSVIVETCLLPGSFPSTHRFSHTPPLLLSPRQLSDTLLISLSITQLISKCISVGFTLQENTPLETPQSMRDVAFLHACCMHKGFIHKFWVINLNDSLQNLRHSL